MKAIAHTVSIAKAAAGGTRGFSCFVEKIQQKHDANTITLRTR